MRWQRSAGGLLGLGSERGEIAFLIAELVENHSLSEFFGGSEAVGRLWDIGSDRWLRCGMDFVMYEHPPARIENKPTAKSEIANIRIYGLLNGEYRIDKV